MVDKSSAPTYNHRGTDKEHITIKGSGFISENTGNIKDFYKISSCIGRGKHHSIPSCLMFRIPNCGFVCRRVWRGKKMPAQGDEGPPSCQNNKQEVSRRGRERQTTKRDQHPQINGPPQHSKAIRVLPRPQALFPRH